MNISISNSILTAQINSKGAELISLQHIQSNRDYIWEGNAKFWAKHSPILFPIVGTLKNNSYSYKNTSYHLPRHGFARDNDFEIIYQTNDEVMFSLKWSSETQKIFPFKFELQLKYSLRDTDLNFSYSIINLDVVEIPFSIGAHPAFALPLDFEMYSLQFSNEETLNCFTLENDLISDQTFPIELEEKKLALNYSLFENDALIFKSLQSDSITILEDKKPLLKVLFSDFKNLGLWTKPRAKFICIEPWLGYSDRVFSNGNLSEKDGIQIVKENKTFQCSFSIQIL